MRSGSSPATPVPSGTNCPRGPAALRSLKRITMRRGATAVSAVIGRCPCPIHAPTSALSPIRGPSFSTAVIAAAGSPRDSSATFTPNSVASASSAASGAPSSGPTIVSTWRSFAKANNFRRVASSAPKLATEYAGIFIRSSASRLFTAATSSGARLKSSGLATEGLTVCVLIPST
jgi:hypothetical protein